MAALPLTYFRIVLYAETLTFLLLAPMDHLNVINNEFFIPFHIELLRLFFPHVKIPPER